SVGEGLLCLHHFHCICNSSSEAVARLFNGLSGEPQIGLGHVNLGLRRFQIEQSAANFEIDLAAQVFELVAPVSELGVVLKNVCFDAAGIEDVELQRAGSIENTVRLSEELQAVGAVIPACRNLGVPLSF